MRRHYAELYPAAKPGFTAEAAKNYGTRVRLQAI